MGKMASSTGLEPVASTFGMSRSIRLIYEEAAAARVRARYVSISTSQ